MNSSGMWHILESLNHSYVTCGLGIIQSFLVVWHTTGFIQSVPMGHIPLASFSHSYYHIPLASFSRSYYHIPLASFSHSYYHIPLASFSHSYGTTYHWLHSGHSYGTTWPLASFSHSYEWHDHWLHSFIPIDHIPLASFVHSYGNDHWLHSFIPMATWHWLHSFIPMEWHIPLVFIDSFLWTYQWYWLHSFIPMATATGFMSFIPIATYNRLNSFIPMATPLVWGNHDSYERHEASGHVAIGTMNESSGIHSFIPMKPHVACGHSGIPNEHTSGIGIQDSYDHMKLVVMWSILWTWPMKLQSVCGL